MDSQLSPNTSEEFNSLKDKNRQLLEENQKLKRQLDNLLGAHHFEPVPLRRRLSHVEKKFMAFINNISRKMNSVELVQDICQEFLKQMEVDRVTVLVSADHHDHGLVITHQAMKEGISGAYLPYYNGMEEQQKPYNRFLKEVLETGLCIYRVWEKPVEVLENLALKGACAISVRDVKGSAFIICLQWMEDAPEWGKTEQILFEDLVRYSSLLLSQLHLIQTLEDLQEQHAGLIESMPSAIIGLDFLGNVTLWNTQAELFFKVAEETVLGRPLSNYIPEFAGIAQDVLEAFQSQDEIVLPNLVRRDKEGRAIYLKPHLFSLLNMERGEIALRIDDVTEQEALQVQLLQSQKMEWVGQLASSLAKQLNAELKGILEGTQEMREDLRQKNELHSEGYNKVLHIEKAAHRTVDVINSLSILAGQRTNNSDYVDLLSLIKRHVELVKTSLEPQIELCFYSKLEKAVVRGVESHLESVFHNLILNSKEAMPQGGRIDVELSLQKPEQLRHGSLEKKSYFLLKFRDFGEGMSSEVLRNIFTPLYSTKKHSSGLGLNVVKKVAEGMRGEIFIKSKQGEGTSVEFFVPCEERYLKEDSLELPTESLPLVLLVEEDPVMQKMMSQVLSDLKLDVCIAADGLDAVKLQNEHKVELVILDWDAQGEGVRETFYLIRQLNPRQKCLITAVPKTLGELPEILSLEGVYFLAKPYTVLQLSESVQGVLV